MKIGVIDAEIIHNGNHRFPNLACMKISSFYKNKGDDVSLIYDYTFLNENKLFNNKKYDKVFISKVFTETEVPSWVLNLKNVEYGGTGFFYDKTEPLHYEIEHSKPDYSLYNSWIDLQIKQGKDIKQFKEYTDYSIGFLTRGCFRKCSFCVNKNYNKVEKHSPLSEFLDESRSKICLLDDNFLGYSLWSDELNLLKKTKKKFKFKQGLDIRLLNEKNIVQLLENRYDGDYTFAFDNIKDKSIIEDKLKLWRRYTEQKIQNIKLYVFCAFDENDNYDEIFWKKDIIDLFERLKILMKYNCKPYVMRYIKHQESIYKGMYINISLWANQPNLFFRTSFEECCVIDNLRKGGNSATIRYLNSFKESFSEISEKYFNIKCNKEIDI